MKLNYLIVLFLLLCTGSQAKEKTDVESKNLKGYVTTLSEINLSCPKLINYSCVLRAGPSPEFVTKYSRHGTDAQGRQTEISYYNSKDKLIKRSYFHYKADNRLAEITQKSADEKLLARVVYGYDAHGYLSEADYYNQKDSLYNPIKLSEQYLINKRIYHFDHSGKLTEQEFYNEDDVLMSKSKPATPYKTEEEVEIAPKTTYNYLGKKAMVTEAYPNGIIKMRTRYNYDREGNLSIRFVTLFDKKGYDMQTLVYNADSTITSQTFTRYEHIDAKGNWHKKIQWSVTDDFDFTYPQIYILNREIVYAD